MMSRLSFVAAVGSLSALAVVDASAVKDRNSDYVEHLPGWPGPLPSSWYSGYLSYDFLPPNTDEPVTIHTHYILVEAMDADNSNDEEEDTKPLIYWSNGGPGASSMFGLFTEVGPLILSDWSFNGDSDVPSPYVNPFTWSRLGHLLVFDQPAPVGFSYCNEDTDPATTCREIAWDDTTTAQNAFAALEAFYRKFPAYANKNLFLTGESYAGIYIPTLAREIMRHNKRMDEERGESSNQRDEDDGAEDTGLTGAIPLAGLAVGDGCLGTETSICSNLRSSVLWVVLFMAGHGQIPWQTFDEVMTACRHHLQENKQEHTSETAEHTDDSCQAALNKVHREAGGFYEYALYDECTYRNDLLRRQLETGQRFVQREAVNDYPCGGGIVMEHYLALPEVQNALHTVKPYYSTDNAEGFNYTSTEKDLTGFYQNLLQSTKLRVLIYNGDTDPDITSFAAQNWTSSLGLTVKESWRPWTVDSCRFMGGYVTRYAEGLDFVTIRGSGHMVPTYKPRAASTFMKAWIEGTPYPPYVPTCSQPDGESPL